MIGARCRVPVAALALLCAGAAAQHVAPPASPADRQRLAREAAEALAGGRIEAASALLEALLAATPRPSAALLANAARCAYERGDAFEAAVLYHRALRRDPADATLRFDLDMARRQLGLGRLPRRDPLARAADHADAVPATTLLLLVAAMQVLGAVLLVLAPRRSGARAAGWLLVLAGVALAARHVYRAAVPPPPAALVQTPVLALHPEPHPGITARVQLQRGDDVRVLAASDRWAEVEHRRGRGWVRRDGLRFIEPPPAGRP